MQVTLSHIFLYKSLSREWIVYLMSQFLLLHVEFFKFISYLCELKSGIIPCISS